MGSISNDAEVEKIGASPGPSRLQKPSLRPPGPAKRSTTGMGANVTPVGWMNQCQASRVEGGNDGPASGALGPGDEPTRVPPSGQLSARFSAQATESTRPEMLLRRELHGRGLRYRVQYRVPGLPRRRVDIAFTGARLALFVDGCFWHACPEHCVVPTANRDWWLWKFQTNTQRDADTDAKLHELGWTTLRIWEHEAPQGAADRVVTLLG